MSSSAKLRRERPVDIWKKRTNLVGKQPCCRTGTAHTLSILLRGHRCYRKQGEKFAGSLDYLDGNSVIYASSIILQPGGAMAGPQRCEMNRASRGAHSRAWYCLSVAYAVAASCLTPNEASAKAFSLQNPSILTTPVKGPLHSETKPIFDNLIRQQSGFSLYGVHAVSPSEIGMNPSMAEGFGGGVASSAETGSDFDIPYAGGSPQEVTSTPGGRFVRGAVFLGGLNLAVFGILLALPKSITRWEDGFVENGIRNLGRAWSQPPAWDEDHWLHNYVGHPYGGSVYYNAIRSQGGNPFESFIFSAFASTCWEYVFEAMAERPSTQDLLITPIVGSLLGELVHQVTMLMKSDGTTFPEAVLIILLNPIHVLFSGL